MKFKEGDKVVPVSKSIDDLLDDCHEWKQAKLKNKNYLIIEYINEDDNTYWCINDDDYNSGIIGDRFSEKDLIPYISSEEKEKEEKEKELSRIRSLPKKGINLRLKNSQL